MGNLNRREKILKEQWTKEDFNPENAEKAKGAISKIEKLIAANGGPEEFFSCGRYESEHELEYLLNRLTDLAWVMIKEGDFLGALDVGRRALEASGVEAAGRVSVDSPDAAIAVTEAVNWAAKTVCYGFYSLKPILIVAASQVGGVSFGCGEDEAYYLGSPTIGTASFHDPNDEIGYLMTRLKKPIPEWRYPWSGVSRQEESFNILNDARSGKGLAEVYADLTSPEEIKAARDKYMSNNFHKRLATIGEMLEHKHAK